MECPKCQGVMVVDYFLDMEASDDLWMPGWRCLLCGNVIDPLIVDHQQRQKTHPDLVGTERVSSTRKPTPPLPVRPIKRAVCRS